MNLDVKQLIISKNPHFFDRCPRFLTNLLISFLQKLLHLSEIENFLTRNSDKKGLALINEIFEYLDFSFYISNKDHAKIPDEGKLICVANHPLGALDSLALLKAVCEIRKEVKIVANDLLISLEGLRDLMLPYDIFSSRPQRKQLENIIKAINNDEAVIFFPAAEVSRLGWRGVRDKSWQNGPVYFAQKYQVPILPVYITGKNSSFFYILSFISKKFSMFLLAHEIYKKRGKNITLKIGDPIPAQTFAAGFVRPRMQTRLLRKHVYLIGKNKKGIFKTEKTIERALDPRIIRKEFGQAEPLGTTADGKKLFAVEAETAPSVLREIARLREITFRKVGEGTGLKLDIDRFDYHYKHIILWDEENLEIVGAYRLGVCKEILENIGVPGLYTATLFDFSQAMLHNLGQAIELGRSFIQPKYWRSHALDQLWQGVGAFLQLQTNVRYLFGAVSISGSYSEEAKDLLVYFYKTWFPDHDGLARARNRYLLSAKEKTEMEAFFPGKNFKEEFKKLKTHLKILGYAVPVLYKQYVDLCDNGGIRFLDFGVDRDFANCVDGLIMLETEKLKEEKKERYFNSSVFPQKNQVG
jgi:putative hemolysin